jgi:hypothetical protein
LTPKDTYFFECEELDLFECEELDLFEDEEFELFEEFSEEELLDEPKEFFNSFKPFLPSSI